MCQLIYHVNLATRLKQRVLDTISLAVLTWSRLTALEQNHEFHICTRDARTFSVPCSSTIRGPMALSRATECEGCGPHISTRYSEDAQMRSQAVDVTHWLYASFQVLFDMHACR